MYEYKALVARVVDADTIDVIIDLGFGVHKTERLRIAGIDAAEVRGPEKVIGKQAKAFVEKLILDRQVIVFTLQEKGKFGRYIADVVYDIEGGQANLGAVLVEKGFAVKVEY
jgi:micrococcal nuclease